MRLRALPLSNWTRMPAPSGSVRTDQPAAGVAHSTLTSPAEKLMDAVPPLTL
jgi:hypothetical protein